MEEKEENKVNTEEIVNKIRLQRDDISWIGISLKGTNAIVKAVKAKEAPEIIDEKEYSNIVSKKGMGLCNEVFTPEDLGSLNGDIGVGHVRYSTAGESCIENAQPLVLNYVKGTLGMAHNGNLLNAVELREELSYTGAIFQTTIDSEVIAYLIARERLNVPTVEDAVLNAMKKIKGAYSLIVMSPRKLIGARDPFGFKPLCIGKRDNAYFLSSETCALDTVGAEFIRDVEPGEVVTITKDGIKSDKSLCQKKTARCIFLIFFFCMYIVIPEISICINIPLVPQQFYICVQPFHRFLKLDTMHA